METLISVNLLCLFILEFHCAICLEVEREDDRCEMMIRRVDLDDRSTVTDDTPSRLHSIWVSQECEVRAGPKYVTRKYSFFKNDTFLLLQYHYADESCSIATYTIVARGSIEISSPSVLTPGATETNVLLDSVHLVPLNRQVARKFWRRINATCGGIETKWRPYSAQLIYERPADSSSNASLPVHDLNSNSLQSRLLRPRKRHTFDCLESFDVEFTELELLRVEMKRLNFDAANEGKARERIELLLGGLPRNVRSRKIRQRPNRLQSTPLLRADTAVDCPICGNVYRATEYSPPLFHEAPSLPAVIGGLWLSVRCESVEGGLWSRRFFRINSDNGRWFARWTYYADYACSDPLYAINAAGIYVQRAAREPRDAEPSNARIFDDGGARLDGPEEDSVRHVSLDSEKSIVLRAYRKQRKKVGPGIPFLTQEDAKLPAGITELELRVLESLLIPVRDIVPPNCKATPRRARRGLRRARRSEAWSKNCIPRTIEAPATLRFKARLGLDWKGDYTLLLASWKDDLWEAPLRRCSETPSRNYFRDSRQRYSPLFRTGDHRYDRFNRQRRHWFSSSFATCFSASASLIHPTSLFLLYWLHFVC